MEKPTLLDNKASEEEIGVGLVESLDKLVNVTQLYRQTQPVPSLTHKKRYPQSSLTFSSFKMVLALEEELLL